ncbi:50S ribosomal protein L22 [Patescibacteria group bacterium]|nr:50S ribosomal protein L22 [Patescibacteria group bacterium]
MEKEISAKLNHLRIAPRKVRLVADMIRGKNALESLTFLMHTSKKAAAPMAKLLQSAIANAKNNFQLEDKNLKIVKMTVDEGPKLKRWRARSMGRAYGIQKKTSHITLILKELDNKKLKGKKIEKRTEKVGKKSKR